MSGDPVSQGFLVEILAQMADRVDASHGRVRQSLNELKADMKAGFERLDAKSDDHARRLAKHTEQLLVIRTEREQEKDALRTRRQDQRDRNVLIATLTSIVVTVGLFVIKAILHL